MFRIPPYESEQVFSLGLTMTRNGHNVFRDSHRELTKRGGEGFLMPVLVSFALLQQKTRHTPLLWEEIYLAHQLGGVKGYGTCISSVTMRMLWQRRGVHTAHQEADEDGVTIFTPSAKILPSREVKESPEKHFPREHPQAPKGLPPSH